ncbi:[LysW]-aminoadipate/[LysW]-glutamate kinase [Candidatus Bathyarchaeota archaeon]|nr:[LysW]-aminoadipate/[LysW]-glutamate kinase [Candidatus Bathyarchaeota archaeon]
MLLVVKLGGSTLEEGVSEEFARDIKNTYENHKLVIVHGGGRKVTEIATRLGKEQKLIVSPEGFRSRYTDRETAEIYTMVMAGKINKEIVLALQRQSLNVIGLSGIDGALAVAERKKQLIIIDERGRKRVIEGGYTGKISRINVELLKILIENGYIPVVAPVAVGTEFEPLNIDGDRMAANIAGSLNADMLILLTDVAGLKLDGKLIQRMSLVEAKDSLSRIGHGMITKVYAAIEAIEMGVKKVSISPGMESSPITFSIENKCGTVIER